LVNVTVWVAGGCGVLEGAGVALGGRFAVLGKVGGAVGGRVAVGGIGVTAEQAGTAIIASIRIRKKIFRRRIAGCLISIKEFKFRYQK
jgi:hypothetical protein